MDKSSPVGLLIGITKKKPEKEADTDGDAMMNAAKGFRSALKSGSDEELVEAFKVLKDLCG